MDSISIQDTLGIFFYHQMLCSYINHLERGLYIPRNSITRIVPIDAMQIWAKYVWTEQSISSTVCHDSCPDVHSLVSS